MGADEYKDRALNRLRFIENEYLGRIERCKARIEEENMQVNKSQRDIDGIRETIKSLEETK